MKFSVVSMSLLLALGPSHARGDELGGIEDTPQLWHFHDGPRVCVVAQKRRVTGPNGTRTFVNIDCDLQGVDIQELPLLGQDNISIEGGRNTEGALRIVKRWPNVDRSWPFNTAEFRRSFVERRRIHGSVCYFVQSSGSRDFDCVRD